MTEHLTQEHLTVSVPVPPIAAEPDLPVPFSSPFAGPTTYAAPNVETAPVAVQPGAVAPAQAWWRRRLVIFAAGAVTLVAIIIATSAGGSSDAGFNDPDRLADDILSTVNASLAEEGLDGRLYSVTCIPSGQKQQFTCHGEGTDDFQSTVTATVSEDGSTWMTNDG